MKLCFYARAGQLEFYVALAKRLVDDGVEHCFVTQHASETKYVRAEIPAATVYEIEHYLGSRWEADSEADWTTVQGRYPHLSLWRMLYVDRFLISYPKVEAVRMARLHFEFFEDVFSRERPDYFVNEAVALFSAYVALEVGKVSGVQYLGTIIARDDARRRFFFVHDVYQRNPLLDSLYPKGVLSPEELDEASSVLMEFRSSPPSPAYMESHKRPPRFRVRMAAQVVKFLAVRRSAMYRDPVRYMSFGRARELYSPVSRLVNYRKSRKFYESPVAGEHFYLLPLHFQPEASTLVCAPKYEKQLIAIDHLAKTLPSDSVLYVKEHYAALGHRDPSFYSQLSTYPNVRLIDPLVDVHGLIQASRAVIVLTSTTGFEALLHGKKVFVLGNVFYDRFENVERIEDVFAAGNRFRDCVPAVGDVQIVRFLAAYRRSLYLGCVAPAFSEFETVENVDAVATSLLEHVGRDSSI